MFGYNKTEDLGTILIFYVILVDPPQPECFGVVQKANYTSRLCSIRWLYYNKNATEMQEQLEENVSVYDIADHEDYTFRAGDMVVRLASNETADMKVLAPAGQVIVFCDIIVFCNVTIQSDFTTFCWYSNGNNAAGIILHKKS